MPRLILLVCALPALLAEEISAPLDCSHLCTTARNGMGSAKAGGCAAERNKMPRPKVGNACSDGFGKGFDDACEAVCMGEQAPAQNQGLACQGYRMELPKPMTMRSCGTGYRAGFDHAVKEMKAARAAAAAAPRHTHIQEEAAAERAIEQVEAEAVVEAQAKLAEAAAAAPAEEEPAPAEEEPAAAEEEEAEPAAAAEPTMLFSMNVTVDNEAVPLEIFDGDDPDEVVTAFCATHMAGAGESCSKQLLPHVTSKIAAITPASVTA